MTWKEIPGQPGYEASPDGSFRSWLRPGPAKTRRETPKQISPVLQRTGYRNVYIRGKRYGAHRLILETFVGPAPSNQHQAAHLNGIPDDNRLENLAWKTPKENDLDKDLHQTRFATARKLTPKDIEAILAVRPVVGERTAERLAEQYGVSDSCIRYCWRGKHQELF
jgi:hypothetical protein